METTMIPFYKQRPFGEVLNTTLEFARQNWLPLWKFVTLLVLPFVLFQAVGFGGLMDENISRLGSGTSNEVLIRYVVNYLLTIIAAIIGSTIVWSTVFALVKVYYDRGGTLKDLQFAELKKPLKRSLWRVIVCFVTLTIIMLVLSSLLFTAVFVTPWTLLITIPLMIWLLNPLSMAIPVYLFEDVSVWRAIGRGYRQGMRHWWKLFGVIIVLTVLVYIVSSFVSTPWYILIMLKSMLSTENDSTYAFVHAPWYVILTYLGSVVTAYVSNLLAAIMPIGLSYLYADMVEQDEGRSLKTEIEQFDEL